MKLLEINNLHAKANGKKILNGLNLTVNSGEIHVIMGPNGAGKSTLANVILSNPAYTKTEGSIWFDGKDITNLKTDEIAKLGIFMSFQTPEEISGISVFNFIKSAKENIAPVDYFKLQEEIEKNMQKLGMNKELLARDVNVGFSGGEKKKNEILQMLELGPKLAILDETDSGLDVDAIKTVSKGIKMFISKERAIIIVTHSTKIIESLQADYVHVLVDGKIVFSGNGKLAYKIEKSGYSKFKA